MINMQDIQKIVKLIIMSGYLKNYKPLSLLVVSKAGNGKTENITHFKGKTVCFMTDITYRGVLDLIKKEPEIKHIIIPDFLKITMKKRSTSDNLVSLLNALTEDGVGKVSMYNYNEDFGGRVCGVILATTKGSFSQHIKAWSSTGFASRMLICSYDYSDETIDKVLDYINSDDWVKGISKKEVITGIKKLNVTCSKSLNLQLNPFVSRKFRTLKQLQTLAKCCALLRKSDKVEQKDIDEVIRLSQYLNLKYTKL